MNTIHTIDFEGNKRLGISEFAVVTLQNLEIVSTRWEICGGNFHKYLEYFLSLRRTGLLAAHSSQTEDDLLRRYWVSPGKVPLFAGDGTTISWGPWMDTKLVYRKLFKSLPSYGLASLVGSFDLNSELKKLATKHCDPRFRSFHSALFDALAAALLVQNLRKYLPAVSNKPLLAIYKK
ncbi:MAG: hypothetical protein LBR91_03180 [Puniceicoccales bacterium]|jgi:hypothetical protein|nr:hypothetical protein [Puniceicoccales bacterium]